MEATILRKVFFRKKRNFDVTKFYGQHTYFVKRSLDASIAEISCNLEAENMHEQRVAITLLTKTKRAR